MYLATNARAVHSYRQVGTATQVSAASRPQLVTLLFDALRTHLLRAENALLQAQLPEKCMAIGKAVRIMEEGLRSSLDMSSGGEISQMLNSLYIYCVKSLTEANLHNDIEKIREVIRLMEPVSQAWKQVALSMELQPAREMVQ